MRLSRLVGRRIKETPRDVHLASHRFLLRGGYVRQVAAGIYSLLPLGRRIIRKIEAIVREEMEAVGGQEVRLPVVMPREMWEESGRYQAVDATMARFQDRGGKDLLLGMTHEEAVVSLARTEVTSYRQLPADLFQIQTKFRDEPRSRGGLIRMREFVMKDAYSFHLTEEDLKETYQRYFDAYEKIFRRAGVKRCVSVESDTGMMGGNIAHEFMLDTPSGEDSLVICDGCGYAANNEVAVRADAKKASAETAPLEKVATPKTNTIDALCELLGVTADKTAKAVFYAYRPATAAPGSKPALAFVLLRGDREVNEIKLVKALGTEDFFRAEEDLIRRCGAVPGYASPVGLAPREGFRLLIDQSVAETTDLVTGANEEGYHFRHFDPERDAPEGVERVDIGFVENGDSCVHCDQPLRLTRGIEIGNIFQLGDKYTVSMSMSVTDQDGKARHPIMGCYGIGIDRLAAAVIEDSHDDRGPIWPASIAPFHVHICALQYGQEEVQKVAEKLYDDLQTAGVEVLLDDTGSKPGPQFADADLIGVPLRLTVAPKALARGVVEFKTRDGSEQGEWGVEEAAQKALEKAKILSASLSE